MFLSSFKRGFCLLLTVIVSCFFMLVFFCNLSQNSLKASAVTTYTTARVDACEDEEETRSYFQRFIDIVETAVSNPEEFFESTFYCTANCIGAIFSDESTMHEVYEKWQAIYNNEEFTIDQMQEIFYYGSDGNLYFTDEYLEQFYDLVDAQTFTLGVVSVPCNYSDEAYSVPLSFGISYVTSFISSILNGSDVYLCKCYTAGYFNDGFCISPYLPVASFSSYSDYTTFCAHSGTVSTDNSGFTLYLYNSDMTLFELTETIYPWYIKSKDSGTGAYIRYTSSNYSLFRPASSFVVQSGCISVNTDSMLYGSGCFTAYTSVDWLEYYLNGGTGVFYDDTGAVYNAVSQDALLYSDNEAAYKALMDSYNNLAAQVADGTYTLSEISDLLSAEIAENIEYIASEEAAQTGYLKSIMESNNSIADAVSSLLSICESINDKLSSLVALSTVDTVADTVTALTSLVTAAEDFVDDLVDDVLDGVYDSVLDGLVDSGYYSDLLSSFKTSFPFSLPYDFFLIVNLLAHDPVEPQITWRMKLDSIGYDEIYSFDVSAFDSVVSVIRVFSSLLFIIALIKITMRLRKKE